jgi:O-succinylbenzoic acid--CoA ligase
VLKNLRFLTYNKNTIEEVIRFIAEWNSPEPSITVQTSGSSGEPKKMSFLKSQLKASAQNTLDTFSIEKGTTAFLCLSIHTIAGKLMVVRAMLNRMELIVGDVSSNALEIPLPEIELAAVVPLQLHHVLKKNTSFPSIKTLLVGGGPVSEDLCAQLSDKGISAIHTYGMTETLTHVAYRRIGALHEELFTPMPGVQLGLAEDRLTITYPEIGIHQLETNDIVQFNTDGHFKVVGRSNLIINSGGLKFNPEELERLISSEMTVPYFFYGLPDDKLGEKIVLVCEGSSFRLTSEQTTKISNVLPAHAAPKEIIYKEQFVRSESMKILRKATMNLP